VGLVRPSFVEVDLDAIEHNAKEIASIVEPSRLCAVVKADGYGHGDVPVAEAAVRAGASWLAVALVEEGVRLREAGIDVPILLLSEPPSDAFEYLTRWDLTPTLYRLGSVARLGDAVVAAAEVPRRRVHCKIDTGMHRVGVSPSDADEVLHAIDEHPALELEGVWTHFAVAESDDEFTGQQLDMLVAFRATAEDAGLHVPLWHAANTAGALARTDARLDMVRVGLGIYGLRPEPHVAADLDLRPAMRVVSRVSHVQRLPSGARPSYGRVRPLPAAATVATVPIGYADGFARRLTQTGGEILVGGRRRPLAGMVTMDQVVVDMGDDPVEVGDEVVIMGTQGEESVAAEEWAERLDTINYEVVCDWGPRLPRRYTRSGA
jgi:alanine racemase